MAIKISDLSVGDWVRWMGKPCKVDVPLLFTEYYGLDEVSEDVSPIPITPEILEANGFEESCGVWYNSEVRMEFERYKDGWCRTVNCGEYSIYFIKYVHQLQHALRLAGVDKEIVMPNK